MSDRVTVYRFDADTTPAITACAMAALLEARGFHPAVEYLVCLPAAEVERLRALQHAEPQTFGGC
jgi:hypothetical protein